MKTRTNEEILDKHCPSEDRGLITVKSKRFDGIGVHYGGALEAMKEAREESVRNFVKVVQEEFKEEHHEYLDFVADRFLGNTKSETKTEKSAFNEQDMISFGNFIRDNYYVAGAPKMLSYHPDKYPHAHVKDIYAIWCCENNK